MRINPIDEYLDKEGLKQETHKELFEGDKNNIDLRTELSVNEIRLVMRLDYVNNYLHRYGIRGVYDDLLIKFMRLQFSKERKSRAEYVDVNKSQREMDAEAMAQQLRTGKA